MTEEELMRDEEFPPEFFEQQAKEMLGKPFLGDVDKYLIEKHGSGCMIFGSTINELDRELYALNLTLRSDNSVGIGRISFTHPRRGHCESLIGFIDSISEKYQIPLIEFGTVASESMKSFVKKHRFIQAPPFTLDDGRERPSSDWHRFTPYGERVHKFLKISFETGRLIALKN